MLHTNLREARLEGVKAADARLSRHMEASMSRILLVEDDPIARSFLADNLCADGFEVLCAETAVAAQRLLFTNFLDLALIDLGLPDGDGLELLELVRGADRSLGRVDPELPLIVLSGRAAEVDRVRGFDRGADDYVCKPFSYPELLRRINLRLRRASQAKAGARLRVGALELDAFSRQAWLGGSPLALSSKEFSLLRTLASDPTRVFTRDELLRLVWGWIEPAAGSTRTLDGHASRLRRKLDAGGAQMIVNVWGVGYRLTDAAGS
jgi:DNA-binding response OmpR family regulator